MANKASLVVHPLDDDDKPILVTGSNSLAGREIVNHLRANGRKVRGIYTGMAGPTELDATLHHRCPLAIGPDLAALIEGAAAIVHTGFTAASTAEQEMDALLNSMDAADIPRLIHLSSVAVYGDRDGIVDETVPLGTVKGDAFGRAKIRDEWAATDWALREPGRLVIQLRLGIVYGDQHDPWMQRLINRIVNGAWGDFEGTGDGWAPLLHVQDLSDAVRIGLERQLLPGVHAINLVAPDPPTWNQLTSLVSDAAGLGGSPRLHRQTQRQHRALRPLGQAAAALGLPLWRSAALSPDPKEIAMLGHQADYHSNAAHQLLGVRQWTHFQDGIGRTFPDVS